MMVEFGMERKLIKSAKGFDRSASPLVCYDGMRRVGVRLGRSAGPGGGQWGWWPCWKDCQSRRNDVVRFVHNRSVPVEEGRWERPSGRWSGCGVGEER